MSDRLPRTSSRELTFENGTAIGISNRWHQGQYCSILTEAGIVGCGIYDLKTPAEFDGRRDVTRLTHGPRHCSIPPNQPGYSVLFCSVLFCSGLDWTGRALNRVRHLHIAGTRVCRGQDEVSELCA